jgi:hypothetical protein
MFELQFEALSESRLVGTVHFGTPITCVALTSDAPILIWQYVINLSRGAAFGGYRPLHGDLRWKRRGAGLLPNSLSRSGLSQVFRVSLCAIIRG